MKEHESEQQPQSFWNAKLCATLLRGNKPTRITRLVTGIVDIAIGCLFVALGVAGKQFYNARPGWNWRLHPVPVWSGRLLFLLGGLAAILAGLHRLANL